MKHKIPQQQMDNLKAALAFWPTVNPDSVNLHDWRSTNEPIDEWDTPHCGSAACFGGWLPYMPHFQALGVTGHPTSGHPMLNRNDALVSAYLFGWSLFSSAGGWTLPMQPGYPRKRIARLEYTDPPGLTHHEIVTKRLEYAIEHSEVE